MAWAQLLPQMYRNVRLLHCNVVGDCGMWAGNKVGQAAVCHSWVFEDGTVAGPGAPPETVAAPIAYTPDDVAALGVPLHCICCSFIHSLHLVVLWGHTGHKTVHNLIILHLTFST
jgi:hypothetical protein